MAVAVIYVKCPLCKKDNVIKFGRNSGKQRYKCNDMDCDKQTFLLDYSRRGDILEIKQKIIDMALNGSGIRETARVLGVSMNTVMSELKKRSQHHNSEHKIT
jgi:insertion element IS1 protein InsB